VVLYRLQTLKNKWAD